MPSTIAYHPLTYHPLSLNLPDNSPQAGGHSIKQATTKNTPLNTPLSSSTVGVSSQGMPTPKELGTMTKKVAEGGTSAGKCLMSLASTLDKVLTGLEYFSIFTMFIIFVPGFILLAIFYTFDLRINDDGTVSKSKNGVTGRAKSIEMSDLSKSSAATSADTTV